MKSIYKYAIFLSAALLISIGSMTAQAAGASCTVTGLNYNGVTTSVPVPDGVSMKLYTIGRPPSGRICDQNAASFRCTNGVMEPHAGYNYINCLDPIAPIPAPVPNPIPVPAPTPSSCPTGTTNGMIAGKVCVPAGTATNPNGPLTVCYRCTTPPPVVCVVNQVLVNQLTAKAKDIGDRIKETDQAIAAGQALLPFYQTNYNQAIVAYQNIYKKTTPDIKNKIEKQKNSLNNPASYDNYSPASRNAAMIRLHLLEKELKLLEKAEDEMEDALDKVKILKGKILELQNQRKILIEERNMTIAQLNLAKCSMIV